MSQETLYRWSKSIDEADLDRWETTLIAADVGYVVEKTVNRKRWKFLVYESERNAAEDLKRRFGGGVSAVRPEDWQPQADDNVVPLKIRDRFIVTQHSEESEIEKLAAAYPGRDVLSFPPRLAFGTGGHPTTAGCLRLLTDAARDFSPSWPMLDIGCGSGILAMAAAKLGADPVDALEHDGTALDVARENAKRHDAERAIRFVEADAVEWVARDPDLTYPLIAANLFSDLLVAILPHLPNHLEPGGTVILSGFLTSQTTIVNEAAAKASIRLDRFLRRGKWVAAAGNLA